MRTEGVMATARHCCLKEVRWRIQAIDDRGDSGEAGCVECWYKEISKAAIPSDPPGEGMGIGRCPVCRHKIFDRTYDRPSGLDRFPDTD
jgi:hypothetical protein